MYEGLIHHLILIPLCYLGIVTSIEDFRQGKIYHRQVLLGLWTGLCWLLLLSIFHPLFLGDWGFVTSLLPRALIASILALTIAFVLWWFDVWSAADAKFFAVLSLMAPLGLHQTGRSPLSVALILLVNAYAVAFIIISGDFLLRFFARMRLRLIRYRQSGKEDRAAMRGKVRLAIADNWLALTKSFLGFVFLLLVIRVVRSWAREGIAGWIDWDETTVFLILFLAFRPLHKLFQIRAVALAVTLSIVLYAAYLLKEDPSGNRLLEIASIGVWSLGLLLFRQVYSYWCSLVELRSIPVSKVTEHMIPSPSARSRLVDTGVFEQEEIKQIGVEGLSVEFAQRIREMFANKTGEDRMEIENTIPFAPFIFLGLLATYAMGDLLIKLG